MSTQFEIESTESWLDILSESKELTSITSSYLERFTIKRCKARGIRYDLRFDSWWFDVSTVQSCGLDYMEYVNSNMEEIIHRRLTTEELTIFHFDNDDDSCRECGIRRTTWITPFFDDYCSDRCKDHTRRRLEMERNNRKWRITVEAMLAEHQNPQENVVPVEDW